MKIVSRVAIIIALVAALCLIIVAGTRVTATFTALARHNAAHLLGFVGSLALLGALALGLGYPFVRFLYGRGTPGIVAILWLGLALLVCIFGMAVSYGDPRWLILCPVVLVLTAYCTWSMLGRRRKP